METLKSPWRRKVNGPSRMAMPDYNDVFCEPSRHLASSSFRLDDYSDIFAAATSASSIPILDLSPVENCFETAGDGAGTGGHRSGVDYSDVFGSLGGGSFFASYEELLAEPKRSGVTSSEGRTRSDVLPGQQEKEVSEHPLKNHAENNEPKLVSNQYSSFPGQSEDVHPNLFKRRYSRMSRETIDNVISDKTPKDKHDFMPGYSVIDESDPLNESKNKAASKGAVDNIVSKGYTPDGGGQKNEASPYSSSNTENFVLNLKEDKISLESNFVSLQDDPGDKEHNSMPSRDRAFYDAAYLNVSEISLQTKPLKGMPPSKPPPKQSMKPEYWKVSPTDSKFDVDEGSTRKSKGSNQLHSSNEATEIHTRDESMKGISALHDAEIDPSSAAAVSIAAIKEAMEKAQVRLASAKKLMEKKRDKYHRKVDRPKALNDKRKALNDKSDGTADEVELKNCCNMIDVSKLSKESIIVEMEDIKTSGNVTMDNEDREMQLLSCRKDQQVKKEKESSEVAYKIVEIAGQWKTDNEYYELIRNDRLLNRGEGVYIQEEENRSKEAVFYCDDRENCSKYAKQAIEVEAKQEQASMDKERENELKGPSVDCKQETDNNLATATMNNLGLKDHAIELEEDCNFFTSDENSKPSDVHEDINQEDLDNGPDSVVNLCLYKENEKMLQNSIVDFKNAVVNGNCEEKELKVAEEFSDFVKYKWKFNASNVNCVLLECIKEVIVPNEAFLNDTFQKEVTELDKLCTFSTTDKIEADEKIKPCNSFDIETRNKKHQYSNNACRYHIEESDNATERDESDELQMNEKDHILAENELEQEEIQDENRLEKPKAQGEIKNVDLEPKLSSIEGDCCEVINERGTIEAQTKLQEDVESEGAFMNHKVKDSEFLISAEGVCSKRMNENITEILVHHKFVENEISSNTADEAFQLGDIDESNAQKVFSPSKEGSLLATAQDATETFLVEMDRSQKQSFCPEVKENISKRTEEREREKVTETRSEEKEPELERDRDRIAQEKAERIAVERIIAEARQRALSEAREKAERAAEVEKASREAKLRAERAAVERATEEARKRAIEKALTEKAAAEARERTAQINASMNHRLRKDIGTQHFMSSHFKEDSEARHKPHLSKIQRNIQFQNASSTGYSDSHNNGGMEPILRNEATQERQQQTAERAAKAIAERNMRDILAQREQAERDRLAESLDGEVRRWASGKEGNLRALLSTLQYILGPDSGWQPIPKIEIINASAVKKAYRKATLCVHPDKLQQRGAGIQQKYICEKVFDLLQDAWNKFNSEERQ